ncbi:MAG: TMEM165/GDT1 family protein [Candidatus Thorarchaeota archaeon]|nr:TMEM165/GDT1 family protein [Candidatus Thorarchaeota archaeon]
MPAQSFLVAFALVLLMELGDKTMLTTMCLSAQSHRPWIVLLATMSALVTATAVGVLIGTTLYTILPLDLLSTIAGVIFLILGVYSLSISSLEDTIDCKNPCTVSSMFSFILISELGDKSQLAILALSAQSSLPILVFAGAVLAFLTVNAVAVFAGTGLALRVKARHIRVASGVIFVVFGLLITTGIL